MRQQWDDYANIKESYIMGDRQQIVATERRGGRKARGSPPSVLRFFFDNPDYLFRHFILPANFLIRVCIWICFVVQGDSGSISRSCLGVLHKVAWNALATNMLPSQANLTGRDGAMQSTRKRARHADLVELLLRIRSWTIISDLRPFPNPTSHSHVLLYS